MLRLSPALFWAVVGCATVAQAASISYTGGVYSQDFNTLAGAAGDHAWVDDSTIPGWYATRTVYRSSSGGDITGNLYAYGAADSTERALGALGSNTSGDIYFGVILTNNTGATLDTVEIAYTGEQWRQTKDQQNTLDVSYALGTSSLTSGVYTAIPQLTFSAIAYNQPAASAVNGNDPAYRQAISFTLSGLNWLDGQTFVLRFLKANAPDVDQGLAADDLTLEASTNAVPTPAAFPAGLALLGLSMRRRKCR